MPRLFRVTYVDRKTKKEVVKGATTGAESTAAYQAQFLKESGIFPGEITKVEEADVPKGFELSVALLVKNPNFKLTAKKDGDVWPAPNPEEPQDTTGAVAGDPEPKSLPENGSTPEVANDDEDN